MSEKIVQLNEEALKEQLKELVRGSVEETLKLTLRLFHCQCQYVYKKAIIRTESYWNMELKTSYASETPHTMYVGEAVNIIKG